MAQKQQRMARAAGGFTNKELRARCAQCHITLGFHGARPPHDRGDECTGFQWPEREDTTKEPTHG